MRPTRIFVPALASALLVAACGGGGDDSADTTAAPTTSAAPSTTAAPTTTARPAATTTSAAETTTTVAAAPVMPLTGLPIEDEVLAARPALVVKIDNHPEARPQFGLNAADIVYEENVENLTRFAAVFQSADSDPVGPIRSGRTQDIDLLGSLNQPLFAWSGGNGRVTTAIRDSDLVEIGPNVARDAYFRDRRSPNIDSEHTLFSTTERLRAYTPVYHPAPPQQFVYRAEGAEAAGEPGTGVDVEMDGIDVTWLWDAPTAAYVRFQNGDPHDDAQTGQITTQNVVVLEVEYRPSPADARSPEAQTIGTGVAYVFSGGNLVQGTWTREDRLQPFTLTDADGNVIELTPGRTWVELARPGTTTPLT